MFGSPVATYTSRAAGKLRRHRSAAGTLSVFIVAKKTIIPLIFYTDVLLHRERIKTGRCARSCAAAGILPAGKKCSG